ncbi:MAG: tetrahydrofolate dehydrogenase/cyclohydrolase catalytic domain-containing protein, partial [Amphiplicatus sp.]
MTAQLIDGKKIAAALRARVGAGAAKLKEKGIAPGLAVVLVGEDPASAVYVRNKGRAAREAGLASFEHRLPATASETDLLALVRTLNEDDRVDGVLVQMPLPAAINAHRVINAIDPEKDVDGLTETSAGRLMAGAAGLVPCTPQGCVILLKTVRPDLSG